MAEQINTEALYTIAKMNGYNGPKTDASLNAFFNSSDALKAKARAVGVALYKGGYIGAYAEGGTTEEVPLTQQYAAKTADLIGGTLAPAQVNVTGIPVTADQLVPETAGQVTTPGPVIDAATVGAPSLATAPAATPAATVTPATVSPQVQQQTAALKPAQGEVSEGAQVTAAQQQESSVSNLQAAQGQAYLINNPVQRQLQAGELIDPNNVAGQAAKAAVFTEQVEAAQATPTQQATVQGQLASLMQSFDSSQPPAWAAGALRNATAQMASRGLGASSLAGQALVQAAMEAALPVAQADASIFAQFEAQNLSNRQQRAMLAAQQRATFLGQEFDQAFQTRVMNASKISDIANMNFTAEQQVQLENARAVNTMNLNNLSNRQALVLSEAAALANLDMANLNNRQSAAVQNAQSFLQMDMANLSNAQQTALFKSQQNIQALFNDQAAQNAAAQFNASSENQTNQFFSSLASQVSQFNASQANAMSQFDASNINSIRQFNADMQNQRDLFNAQNGLIVAQANAQWRQNVATIDTAAINESASNYAKTLNAFTQTNLDAYWQRERDIMSFAFTSSENAADRMSSIMLQKMEAESKAEYADNVGTGALTATLVKGALNWISGGKTGM